MSVTEIRDAILDKFNDVNDIGKVHNRQRYTKDQMNFRAWFIENEKLLGWTVSRKSSKEVPEDSLYNKAVHRWQIKGYMALEDAEETEILFDDLVEKLRASFRKDETLGGVVDSTYTDGIAGLQLDDTGPVMFAGVLCHAATLTLATKCDVEICPLDPAELDDFLTANVEYDVDPADGSPEVTDTFTLETEE